MYTGLQIVKELIKSARETFEGTAADVTPDQLHALPGGKALPLGAVYAHLILSEDLAIQSFLQGKPALYEGEWKNNTGVSIPMPAMDANWAEANAEWSKNVKIELEKLRAYSRAVYVATDAYVSSLSDADLEKEIDLGSWGKQTVSYVLCTFIIGHTYSIAGEASALKGIQGAKGYPF